VDQSQPAGPNTARVYNYLKGGRDNLRADRDQADRLVASAPELREVIDAMDAAVSLAVAHLTGLGVLQMIELGSGIPVRGRAVHEWARADGQPVQVIYVDSDPVAVAGTRTLISDTSGVDACEADAASPAAVLGSPDFLRVIDPGRPAVVVMAFGGGSRFVTESLPPEDPRNALIREQAAALEAQAGQITALTALVAELREQLNAARRAASRNPGGSSMPPSGDDRPRIGPRARKERREFRRAVVVGLATVSRVPGPRNAVKQKPGRELLEFCRDQQDSVLRFAVGTSVWPTTTSASAASAR